jgi:hypothetical protein
MGCLTKEEEKVRDLTRAYLNVLEAEEVPEVSLTTSGFHTDDCISYRLGNNSNTNIALNDCFPKHLSSTGYQCAIESRPRMNVITKIQYRLFK